MSTIVKRELSARQLPGPCDPDIPKLYYKKVWRKGFLGGSFVKAASFGSPRGPFLGQ